MFPCNPFALPRYICVSEGIHAIALFVYFKIVNSMVILMVTWSKSKVGSEIIIVKY